MCARILPIRVRLGAAAGTAWAATTRYIATEANDLLRTMLDCLVPLLLEATVTTKVSKNDRATHSVARAVSWSYPR